MANNDKELNELELMAKGMLDSVRKTTGDLQGNIQTFADLIKPLTKKPDEIITLHTGTVVERCGNEVVFKFETEQKAIDYIQTMKHNAS